MVEGGPGGRPAFCCGAVSAWTAAASRPGWAWGVAGLPAWWIPPHRVVGYRHIYYTT